MAGEFKMEELKILWEKYGYENWGHKKYRKSFKIFYLVIRIKHKGIKKPQKPHKGSIIYKKE